MNSVEQFLTAQEEKTVVQAIQKAEKNTSGEIRVHIEETPNKPSIERAKEVFLQLNMDKTAQRNAVLFYIATETKQFAIVGDEEIDKKVTDNFWQEETKYITSLFKQNKNCKALEDGISMVGEKLKLYFPYQSGDKDELSNEISKG